VGGVKAAAGLPKQRAQIPESTCEGLGNALVSTAPSHRTFTLRRQRGSERKAQKSEQQRASSPTVGRLISLSTAPLGALVQSAIAHSIIVREQAAAVSSQLHSAPAPHCKLPKRTTFKLLIGSRPPGLKTQGKASNSLGAGGQIQQLRRLAAEVGVFRCTGTQQ